MAYTTNPHIPNVRRKGVNLVLLSGWSAAEAARYLGVHRSTIWRWLRLPGATDQRIKLVTRSARPLSHPRQLAQTLVERIVALREQYKRCAGYIHALLCREGVAVSLASVGRVLARAKLSASWYGQQGKERRKRMSRPKVGAPGSFLQLDTIHFTNWQTKERYFVYTLIDLKSRWAYAEYRTRISPAESTQFITKAQRAAPFAFQLLQTDNGQEFSSQFEAELTKQSIPQRRIRLGKKNDNAHIERFNRTIQDECLGRWPATAGIQKRLTAYLDFYNTKRLHSGIQYRTPLEVLQRF